MNAQPPDPQPNVDRIYWRIRVPPDAVETLIEWNTLVAARISKLASEFGLDYLADGKTNLAPGKLGGWEIPPLADSAAGQVDIEQGVIPLLVLMTMKAVAPGDVRVSLATEDGIEISSDPRNETKVLENYGTDIERVRPMAEVLELMQPRINWAEAISSEDYWL